MMKNIILNDKTYIVEENYKNSLNIEELESMFTDYFYDFDYILGDYAYGKLRLKGFYDKKNKNVKKYNNILIYKDYLKEFCATECPYFLIKKQINIEKSK